MVKVNTKGGEPMAHDWRSCAYCKADRDALIASGLYEPVGSKIDLSAKCVECGRVFDLLDPTDADEWANGHDCED